MVFYTVFGYVDLEGSKFRVIFGVIFAKNLIFSAKIGRFLVTLRQPGSKKTSPEL